MSDERAPMPLPVVGRERGRMVTAEDLKKLQDARNAARDEYERFAEECKDAQGVGWEGAEDAAHFAGLQVQLEARKRLYDVRDSDYQAALNDDANRRNEDAERRHREDMKAAESAALSRAEKSDEIQHAMTRATESMTKATWIFGTLGAILVFVQVYKSMYPSPTPPWTEPPAPVGSTANH